MVETLLAEFREAPNFREGMMKVFDFLIECDCRSFSLFHFCDTEMLALAFIGFLIRFIILISTQSWTVWIELCHAA